MAVFISRLLIYPEHHAATESGFAGSFTHTVVTGGLALLASLMVTFLYHFGCREFRNRSMLLVWAGNTIITLSFVLSGSLWAAAISYAVIHIAAVLRGPDTTFQLPPHYQLNTGERYESSFHS